ncbi:MAG: cytochrome c-type biogenesis protein CcmH [Sedimenticola sp.]|nr:MAG: cytochrome c-type biogenesis protein CcmH [Sedimenticola sp.]
MRRLWFVFFLLVPLVCQSSIEAYSFEDPEKEARYKVLIDELRCLVCQNQNLAASNAELAKDMRRLTYDMVQRGATNEEVVTYMVDRYGDFVMYRPPFNSSTYLLWIGPFIILGIAILVLAMIIRRKGQEQTPVTSDADLQRVEHLLNPSKDKSA